MVGKNRALNFVLPALNLLGVFLVIIGVFVFANSFANRSFDFGGLRLPGDPAFAVALIACGLVLFGAASVAGNTLKGKK